MLLDINDNLHIQVSQCSDAEFCFRLGFSQYIHFKVLRKGILYLKKISNCITNNKKGIQI